MSTTALSHPPRLGLLVRLWRFLFGDPPARRRMLDQCSAETVHGFRCRAIEDPRCRGRNCTAHCRRDCQGACLGQTQAEEKKAQDPDPTLGGTCWLSTCPSCQAVNRIPKEEKGSPNCGRCKTPLLRPS